MFLLEDLDFQEFQLDFDAIIEYFLSGKTHFDQEDDMIIIDDFCGNLKNIFDWPQIFESHDMNNDSNFDNKLTMFPHNSNSRQVSSTLQLMLIVMSGSCHHYCIGDFV